ncbi:MAG: M6 family metalloprotease domain-containing protein [Candidatus Homeothermus sp.]|nr:M6 family metalloprotease domain-containing protein [Candidatus Homeothermus sp.]
MKNFISYICLFVAIIAAASVKVHAVKAQPGLITVTQPDGTQLSVRLIGDEHFHYFLTEDGYPLINDNDVYYYASSTPDGKLLRSPMKALPASMRSQEAKKFLQKVDAAKTVEAMPRRYGLFPGSSFPAKGEQKALVILVEFADCEFFTPDANQYFTSLLNAEGCDLDGASGSARDYFVQNSSGIFLPDFDVYGPVILSQPVKYYGGNDRWGNDEAPHKMIIEACQLLDSEVDFSLYDRDGDGTIDNVFVFYAGRGEATSGGANTVWPHSARITEWEPMTEYLFDGVMLDSYACTNEQVGNHTCGIGTFCHEFSHVLGLPDLYATSYSTAFTPGDWSLLDSGSYNNGEKTPAGYSIFERYALGWIDPKVITGAEQEITLRNVAENDGGIIATARENEFFLLENRQQTGWDTYIPGHGMLVWHVDYRESVWANNTVNNSQRHQYVDLEEADNIRSAFTRTGDAFPGTAGVTEFTADTTPALRPWSGDDMHLALTGITETDDGLINFTVTRSSDNNSASISTVESEEVNISVYARTISIRASEPIDITVLNTSGISIYSVKSVSATVTVPGSGLYIVTLNGSPRKILVK